MRLTAMQLSAVGKTRCELLAWVSYRTRGADAPGGVRHVDLACIESPMTVLAGAIKFSAAEQCVIRLQRRARRVRTDLPGPKVEERV